MRADVEAFLHAICFAAPALTTYFALRGLSEGLSMPRPSMYFSFGGLVVLAPLGYVLMYGKLGFPVMGARGSGIATAIVLWLEMLGFAIYVLKHRNYRDLNLRGRMARPDRRQIAQLLHIGLPMAVTLLMEAGLFVAVALLIGRLGETVTASHHVALNVASVAFMIPLGLSMAITVRVGNAAGRRDVAGVRYAGLSGITLVLVTQFVSSGIMLLFPAAIASLYTHDRDGIAAAHTRRVLPVFRWHPGGLERCAAWPEGHPRAHGDHPVRLLDRRHADRMVAGLRPWVGRAWHVDGPDRRSQHGGHPAFRAVLAEQREGPLARRSRHREAHAIPHVMPTHRRATLRTIIEEAA
jgi:MATE family multidrug resistance protein